MKTITPRNPVTAKKIVFTLLILYGLFCLFPLLLAFINSFKTKGEMFTNILSLPNIQNVLKFENYITSFTKMNYLRSFINTTVIAGTGIIGIVIFSSLAGWALSRIKGALSGIIFSCFVVSMLVPFNAIMIPLYRISVLLHISNSLYGLGGIYTGLGVSMAIFMYHGFVKSIPMDLEDAAYIDGCGTMATFRYVVFPLLVPVTATIGIMNILWMWNDFLLPLIMLQNSKKYTLLLSTNMLFGQYSSDWPAILSALLLAALPMVLVYALLQKHILKGIVEGALKG